MTEHSSFFMQGSVSAVAVAFLQAAVLRMVPYAIPAIVLIALDLLYGVKAAKFRCERVRFSTAITRTVTKTFSYICWIILASTLALAFGQDWLEWLVLGLVYMNEFASIVGNYLETKGLTFSFEAFYKWLFRKAGHHVGVDISEDDANEMIKPKRQRKEKNINQKGNETGGN